MAYFIDEDGNAARGSSRQVSFYADEESDIAKLPTSSFFGEQQGEDTISNCPVGRGSSCLVIGSGNLYILNSYDQWKKI